MRILTICSDGVTNIAQHAQWSGYSSVAGILLQEVTKDVEILLKSVAAMPVDKAMQKSIPETTQSKEEKIKNLKAKIDQLLEEINLIQNYT